MSKRLPPKGEPKKAKPRPPVALPPEGFLEALGGALLAAFSSDDGTKELGKGLLERGVRRMTNEFAERYARDPQFRARMHEQPKPRPSHLRLVVPATSAEATPATSLEERLEAARERARPLLLPASVLDEGEQ